MHKFKYIIISLVIFIYHNIYSQENLLKNGDFEENDGSLPSFWGTYVRKKNQGKVKFYLEKGNSYMGKYCVTIENLEENDSMLLQKVKVKPNTYYKLFCRIRAEGMSYGRLGAYITLLGIVETSLDFKATDNVWVYAELYGVTGRDQDYVVVSARVGGYGDNNFNKGKASFDDIRLIELDGKPKVPRIAYFYKKDTKKNIFDRLASFKVKKPQNAMPLIILFSLFFIFTLYIIYEYFIKNIIKNERKDKQKKDS